MNTSRNRPNFKLVSEYTRRLGFAQVVPQLHMNPKDSINKASNQGSHYPNPYVGSAQYKKDLEDYGAHLRNWPQNSTQMLHRVHSQADVKRFALIQAIINLREPEGRLTGAQDMLSAGLPSLLLDILSHRNSYVIDSDPHVCHF